MSRTDIPFWEQLTLEEMNPAQWEALCDGCGLCCLHKLEDEETGVVYYTRVACRYLNCNTCECTVYDKRRQWSPQCVKITPTIARKSPWLPESCAYRRLAEGQGLLPWHPLVSGRRNPDPFNGLSIKNKCIPEDALDQEPLVEYLLTEDEARELYGNGC